MLVVSVNDLPLPNRICYTIGGIEVTGWDNCSFSGVVHHGISDAPMTALSESNAESPFAAVPAPRLGSYPSFGPMVLSWPEISAQPTSILRRTSI